MWYICTDKHQLFEVVIQSRKLKKKRGESACPFFYTHPWFVWANVFPDGFTSNSTYLCTFPILLSIDHWWRCKLNIYILAQTKEKSNTTILYFSAKLVKQWKCKSEQNFEKEKPSKGSSIQLAILSLIRKSV